MERDNDILILANPNGNAWDFAKQVYEKLKFKEERERRYRLIEIHITKFNDGEIFVRVNGNVRKKTCYFIHDSSMPPQDWIVSLGLVNDALMRSSAKKICNVLPYIKYSRQDRMTDPRTPISTAFIANILNSQAYRIITTDLHNPAVQGAYKIPFDNLKAYPVIIEHLKKNYPEFLQNAIIVAPDVGSAKRAESYAKRLNCEVALINKKRDVPGIIEEMTIIGNVEGKNVLLVDDMIDTAGTLCKAAEVLKQKGARDIIACATHGIFSKDAEQKIELSSLNKIIITDSIPQNKDGKIEIISLTDLLAEAIFRISHGISVSELFK